MSQYAQEYIHMQYIPVSLLSDSGRCKVELVKCPDGSMAVKKTFSGQHSFYSMLRNLRHPGLARILEVADSIEETVIVEEYISGRTLQQIMDSQLAVAPAVFYNWLNQLAAVMIFIHAHNIIHRDIKPSNIIISNDGILKLIDFDSARTFQTGQHHDTEYLGTKGYAAPEQYGYAQTDGRSDIYSFGRLCEAFITARPDPVYQLQSRLQDIIKKCTPLDPNQRYQNSSQLLDQINSRLLPVQGTTPQPEYRSRNQHNHFPGSRQAAANSRLTSEFTVKRIWRFIVFGIYTLFILVATPSVPQYQTWGMIPAIAMSLWIFLPPFMFIFDNFLVRTVPVIPLFKRERNLIVYIVVYLSTWFSMIFVLFMVLDRLFRG